MEGLKARLLALEEQGVWSQSQEAQMLSLQMQLEQTIVLCELLKEVKGMKKQQETPEKGKMVKCKECGKAYVGKSCPHCAKAGKGKGKVGY